MTSIYKKKWESKDNKRWENERLENKKTIKEKNVSKTKSKWDKRVC